jgi:hypothetical protein
MPEPVWSVDFARGVIQTLAGTIAGALLAFIGTWASDKRALAREQRQRLFDLRKDAILNADRVWLAALSLAYDTSTPWTMESLNTKVAEIVPPLQNARMAFGLPSTPANTSSITQALFAAAQARGTPAFAEAHNKLLEAVTEAVREIRAGWARELASK